MKTEKQQTAVEWFFEQLTEVDYGCINKTFLQNNNTLAGHKLRELLEQAKEMEKNQIKSAFTKGDLFSEDYFYPEKPNVDCSENYYNETYKQQEQ
jgi:hypothetical protein